MRPNNSSFVLGSLVAFFAVLTAAATGCSGAGTSGVGTSGSASATGASTPADGLPCCHAGFIYKCASESALNACSDDSKDETTDCTKTATECGGGDTPTAVPTTTSTSKPPPPPPPKSKTGEKCNDATECEGGQCLVYGTGTVGFCSNVCSNNSQCPNQFRCQLAEKLGVKVCAPVGDAKLGDSCTTGLDCASELCLTPGSGGVGYCSATCNAPADCGLNWQCAPVAGAAGKFCQR